MSTELRNFLAIPYDELEQLNLNAKEQRKNRVALHKIQEERLKYLTDETRIKALTVLFSDLEGRLHMLDYDKKFLLKSWDNLTFDGSSIRGFTAQRESDLRLGIDWSCFLLGAGGYIWSRQSAGVRGCHRQGRQTLCGRYPRCVEEFRRRGLHEKKGYTLNAANEIEGFLFQGETRNGIITRPGSSNT